MGCTLVIDTSYGSTVGVVGCEPIVETDSRTHVEKLQTSIACAVADAGLRASDIETIVVGVGPAPFTGLRAGIVAAKALAFATGATIVGQNILDPQHAMMRAAMGVADPMGAGSVVVSEGALDGVLAGVGFLADVPQCADAADAACHVTLCVNDARRKQLYCSLDHGAPGAPSDGLRWIDMDIDYPESIVARVNAVVAERAERDGVTYVVDVAGHGAAKYAAAWDGLDARGVVVDGSLLDVGATGLAMFAALADAQTADAGGSSSVDPLYLRRPDAEIPNPLKHVLGHAGAGRTR